MLTGSSGDQADSGSSGGPGVGGLGEEGGGGDRGTGGNRWPRQETVALIKIRTDMDVAFRDSSLKGPLWDEVSRKLAELGYHRSAKKCKEKFENVSKYHKRTKEGRGTKSEGKTYRFFDQLQALDSTTTIQPSPTLSQTPHAQTHQATPLSVAMPVTNPIISNTNNTTNTTTVSLAQTLSQLQQNNPISILQSVAPNPNPLSISFSATNPFSSSSTSSEEEEEEEPEEERRKKRKRKWADFFEKLTSEVMQKQEEMQRKFLEALDTRERERAAREEAWRAQESARMVHERELLAQEKAMAAAKDAAVFAFLQKISSDQQISINPFQIQQSEPLRTTPLEPVRSIPPPLLPSEPVQKLVQPSPPPPATALTLPRPAQLVLQSPPLPQPTQLRVQKPDQRDNGGENLNLAPSPSPSRWPKAEVEALIKLRTNLDLKYQENVPKGPLWEEISLGMVKLGYNRNAKRCKEKWENINKYFKKVKESNKKRPEDSKTCPYFTQLDAIYKERAKGETTHSKIEYSTAPIMAQPEQQWPIHPQDQVQNRPELPLMEGQDSDDDDDVDNDEEEEAGNYELVANKPSSMGTVE